MMNDEQFDQLLSEIRGDETIVSGAELKESKDRVRAKLEAASRLSGPCAEFRPELASYVEGSLSEARRMLVDDHLSRCAGCRKALAELKGEAKVVSIESVRKTSAFSRYGKWAIAAGIAAIALFASRERIDKFMAPSGPRATVVQVAGSLMRLPGESIKAGASVNEGDVIRTGQGSRATLQLADGSKVEMNERSELFVTAKWSGQDVNLERGDVIVEAAKQRRGFLRVVTHDSVASVKGTVFAVSAGAAGSLVTVVEGAVQVEQGSSSRLVSPNQRAASTPALENVTPREAVGWSENREKYFTVLTELSKLEKELAALPTPALRTQAKLLPLLPANTNVYVAIPNLGGTIQEGMRLIEQRAQTNAVLQEWWGARDMQDFKKAFSEISAVAPMIGDEIVFALAERGSDRRKFPVVLAEVRPGQRAALQAKIDAWVNQAGGTRAESTDKLPAFSLTENLFVLTEKTADLAAIQSGNAGSPSGDAFSAEIQKRYQRGAGWLVGINLEEVVDAGKMRGSHSDAMKNLFDTGNVRHLFLEQRSSGSLNENSAVLTFKQARTGVASWLAEPAASGSAEYVSPQATIAASAVTRNPRQAFDEMLNLMGRLSPKMIESMREFEAQTGVSLSNDVASALGTDFTLAVEAPKIPIPDWMLAIEAYRPDSIVNAFERFAQAYNAKQTSNEFRVTVKRENANGRDWTTVSLGPVSFDMTFDRGYLVAGRDRALVTRAIQTRDSGFSLVRSASFRQQLPNGGGLHSSAFVWINTQTTLKDVLNLIENPALKQMLDSREPVLLLINAETERIQAVSRNRFTSLLFDTMLASEGDASAGPKKTPKHLKATQAN